MPILSRDDPSSTARSGAPSATASPGRSRRRLPRISPVLAVLLAVALVEALAWTIALPPLQGPDEISHFAYTERLVETQSIPWYPGGAPSDPGPSASTATLAAALYGGIFAESRNPFARPPGSELSVQLWDRQPARDSRKDRADGGYTSAMKNPPLYYIYAALPYAATYPLDFFDREFAMRLANIPPLLAIVALTWAIAGLLLPGRALQTLATAAVALNPQLTHLTAVVNPDVLLAAEWAAFFYLALLVLTRGPTRWRLVGIALLSVASCLTHARGVAILAPAAFVYAVAWWRWRTPSRRAKQAFLAGTAVALVAAVYVVLRYATLGPPTASSTRQFVSYLWQFYLPKLPFMSTTFRPDWTVRDAFIDRFYGTFAQLEVFFSPSATTWLARASAAAVVLALVGLAVRLRSVRAWPAALTVMALLTIGAVSYVLDMHVAAFRSLASGDGDPVVTGRYLLPLIAIYGLGIALAVSWLPRRAAAAAGGVVLGGLVLLQLAAMGILVGRFYA
jgi:Predicted membrane protein (DUF2142)